MSKRQALALVGLGAAGYAVYRATRRVEDAADRYRQRGPRWDVILFGVLAAAALVASADQAKSAVKRARRAF